jgi:lipoprotein-anchoring transpeptidase ErfK/SrfK
MLRPLARGDYDWHPERSESGPITIVVSSADHALYVYRNGNAIGRGAVEVSGRGGLGERVYSLLEGTTGKESSLAPGRAARRWMNVTTNSGRDVDADKIAARLRFNPDFATKLYDTITPGTTVILTDHAVVRNANRGTAIFQN